MCPNFNRDLGAAGAIRVEDWEGAGQDRGRYFEHAAVDVGDATLTIRGIQYADGRKARSIPKRLDEEIQAQGDDLTPFYARRLAAMLHNSEDTCDLPDGTR